jgi:drug/metabolite transporter (DMT)-like permease
MGKVLLETFSPSQVGWLRYAGGLLAYLVAAAALRLSGHRGSFFYRPRGFKDAFLVFVLGFSAFCFSPLLQLTGLASSRATDNVLIIAMEPLIAVLLAWVLLRERPTRAHLAAFAVALGGFALLSSSEGDTAQGLLDPHAAANLLILLALVGEALYSSLGRKLVEFNPPVAVFGSALLLGVLSLTLATAAISGLPSWTQISTMPARGILSLLWLGPFGTTLSYLYWISALKKAPVASLALTLFVQPLFGPFWGMFFLGERLTVLQWIGSGLILGAVFGQTWLHIRRPKLLISNKTRA